MKQSGAWLTARALENIGVRYTFGIPGVHNTEIYDQLNEVADIKEIVGRYLGEGAPVDFAQASWEDLYEALPDEEGLALLRDAEGRPDAGGIHDVLEVDEDALGRLRAEIDHGISALDRPHVRLEHEIELPRRGEFAVAHHPIQR